MWMLIMVDLFEFFVAAKYMVLLIINKFDFKSCDTHFLLEIFCHTHKSHKKNLILRTTQPDKQEKGNFK